MTGGAGQVDGGEVGVRTGTPAGSAVSRGRRVAFAGSLLLTMGVGSYPLFAVSALAPMVTADLGISRTQLGTVSALAFAIAAVGAVTGGMVINRRTARAVLVVLYLAGAAACVAVAAADSYVELLVAAAIAGISMSASNPITNHLIAERLPAGRRGTLMGVKQSGVQVAQLMAGALLPTAAALWHWRGAVAVSVVVPLLGLAAAILLFRPLPVATSPTQPAPRRERLDPVVWRLSGYALLLGTAVQATSTYLTLYAYERVGLSVAVAGLAIAVIGLVGTIARVVWGRWAGERRADGLGLVVIAVLSAVAMLALLSAAHVGAFALWVGTVLFGASGVAANVVVMVAVMRRSGPRQTAQASGVVGGGLYLGFMLGPPAFGALVDALDSYDAAWVGLAVLCVAAATVGASLSRSESRRG